VRIVPPVSIGIPVVLQPGSNLYPHIVAAPFLQFQKLSP